MPRYSAIVDRIPGKSQPTSSHYLRLTERSCQNTIKTGQKSTNVGTSRSRCRVAVASSRHVDSTRGRNTKNGATRREDAVGRRKEKHVPERERASNPYRVCPGVVRARGFRGTIRRRRRGLRMKKYRDQHLRLHEMSVRASFLVILPRCCRYLPISMPRVLVMYVRFAVNGSAKLR